MTKFRTFERSNSEFTPAKTCFVTAQSPALGRRGDIVIYNTNPSSVDAPVIILLHGVYGSAWAWLYAGGAHLVYEQLRSSDEINEFVLVMPSDGLVEDGSGYYNREDARYRDWIVEDVMAAVQQTIPAVSASSRVYISGLSMGGYGALRLGCLYPEKFAAISAHSPITGPSDFELFTKFAPDRTLHSETEPLALSELMVDRATSIPPFRFDCGRSDILFESNQRLNNALMAAGVAHEYLALEGEHNWAYWHRELARTFRFFSAQEKAATRPQII